jgi:hypothetical protein
MFHSYMNSHIYTCIYNNNNNNSDRYAFQIDELLEKLTKKLSPQEWFEHMLRIGDEFMSNKVITFYIIVFYIILAHIL